MTDLEGCIQFWQSKLDHERYLSTMWQLDDKGEDTLVSGLGL